jgi:CRISPR-associated protein Cst2
MIDNEEQSEGKITSKQSNAQKKAIEATVYRTSPVRISPAISLEPYQGDTEMLTNKYQSDKIQAQPNIASAEVHQSLYCYTVSIDLHRVGTEQDEIGTRMSYGGGKDDPNKSKAFKKFQEVIRSHQISYPERKQRVMQLLDIIGRLFRDIRGRREDLKPLFIVGGVYDVCNPFFLNMVRIDTNGFREKGFQPRIKPEPIIQFLKDAQYTLYGISVNDETKNTTKTVMEETFIGIRDGFFNNTIEEWKAIHEFDSHVGSPEFAISKVKEKVADYYDKELVEEEKTIDQRFESKSSP